MRGLWVPQFPIGITSQGIYVSRPERRRCLPYRKYPPLQKKKNLRKAQSLYPPPPKKNPLSDVIMTGGAYPLNEKKKPLVIGVFNLYCFFNSK